MTELAISEPEEGAALVNSLNHARLLTEREFGAQAYVRYRIYGPVQSITTGLKGY